MCLLLGIDGSAVAADSSDLPRSTDCCSNEPCGVRLRSRPTGVVGLDNAGGRQLQAVIYGPTSHVWDVMEVGPEQGVRRPSMKEWWLMFNARNRYL